MGLTGTWQASIIWQSRRRSGGAQLQALCLLRLVLSLGYERSSDLHLRWTGTTCQTSKKNVPNKWINITIESRDILHNGSINLLRSFLLGQMLNISNWDKWFLTFEWNIHFNWSKRVQKHSYGETQWSNDTYQAPNLLQIMFVAYQKQVEWHGSYKWRIENTVCFKGTGMVKMARHHFSTILFSCTLESADLPSLQLFV